MKPLATTAVLLLLALTGTSSFAADQTVQCDCNYLFRSPRENSWAWVAMIQFQANRDTYQAVGEKVCLAKAKAILLEPHWDGESVSVSDCRFVQ